MYGIVCGPSAQFRQVSWRHSIECLVSEQAQLVVDSLWHSQPMKAITQQLGHPRSRIHHPLKTVQIALETVSQKTVAIIDSADDKAVDDRSCNVEREQLQRALHPPQLVEAAADNTSDLRLERQSRVDNDTEVAYGRHRSDQLSAELDGRVTQLTQTARGRAPHETAKQTFLGRLSCGRPAEDVHLGVVCVEVRFDAVLLRDELEVSAV